MRLLGFAVDVPREANVGSLPGIRCLYLFDFVGIKHRRVITAIQDITFQGGVLPNQTHRRIFRLVGISGIYKAGHVEA